MLPVLISSALALMGRSGITRIKAEVQELHCPVWIGIAQALDVDPAREAAFDRCLNELWGEKREREREIDLTDRASLTLCQLRGVAD